MNLHLTSTHILITGATGGVQSEEYQGNFNVELENGDFLSSEVTQAFERHEAAIGRGRRDESEQRAVKGVEPGRHDPDPAKPEREDRVLAVPRLPGRPRPHPARLRHRDDHRVAGR